MQRAQEAVRADGRRVSCDVFVTLRAGTYRLGQPLVLDWRDSGVNGHEVTYRAAPGERATISGAIPVRGWSMHDAHLGIQRAYVGPQRTRQLYVNGVRAVRAQTVPYPADFERTVAGYRFVSPGNSMPLWTNPAEIEAVTVTQWKMMRCPVVSIVGPDITMGNPCWDTQYTMTLNDRPSLTRAGIGQRALALTCRLRPGVPRALPGRASVT